MHDAQRTVFFLASSFEIGFGRVMTRQRSRRFCHSLLKKGRTAIDRRIFYIFSRKRTIIIRHLLPSLMSEDALKFYTHHHYPTILMHYSIVSNAKKI